MDSLEVPSMRPEKRKWIELAWIVKVLLAAALVLLALEVAGVHEGGVLLRLSKLIT